MKKLSGRIVTGKKRDKILEDSDYTYAYCGGWANQIDHVIPWAYKPIREDYNLVACCAMCNLVANDRVFNCFYDKQSYILSERKETRKHPVSIWIKSELTELGHNLSNFIISHTIVASDGKHRNHIKGILLSSGFSVNINGIIYKPRCSFFLRRIFMMFTLFS